MCVLDEYIIIDGNALRYNLNPLKKIIEKDCQGRSLCYNKKYIGPIKNKKLNEMFFFSLFEPDRISIPDFSYISNADYNTTNGHIYGLFDKTLLETNHTDTGYLKKNITHGSVKYLQRLAGQLENLNFVSDNNYSVSMKGILLNYKEGDICAKDKTKNFKAYMFLVCKRDLGLKIPTLVKVLDGIL